MRCGRYSRWPERWRMRSCCTVNVFLVTEEERETADREIASYTKTAVTETVYTYCQFSNYSHYWWILLFEKYVIIFQSLRWHFLMVSLIRLSVKGFGLLSYMTVWFGSLLQDHHYVKSRLIIKLTTSRAGAAHGGNPQVGRTGVKENLKNLRWTPDANLSVVCRLGPK